MLGLSHGAEIGDTVALELNGNTYAPIHDSQGNIVGLVDPSGNLKESYRYTAPHSIFEHTKNGQLKCFALDGRGAQFWPNGTLKGFIEKQYEKF